MTRGPIVFEKRVTALRGTCPSGAAGAVAVGAAAGPEGAEKPSPWAAEVMVVVWAAVAVCVIVPAAVVVTVVVPAVVGM